MLDIDKLLAVSVTFSGREKLVRFFQYLSNYLSISYNDNILYKNLAKQFSLVRKFFRLFRFLNVYLSMKKQWKKTVNQKRNFIFYIKILTSLSLIIFYFTDNLLLLNKLNISSFSTNTIKLIQYYSDLSWVIEIALNILTSSLGLIELNNKKEKYQLSTIKQQKHTRSFIHNIFDFPIAMYYLGYHPHTQQLCYLLGTITSLMSLESMYTN